MATKVLREVGQFQLIKDELTNLYRFVNTILLENTEDEGVSYWFDSENVDTFLVEGRDAFINRATQAAGNDIGRFTNKIQ